MNKSGLILALLILLVSTDLASARWKAEYAGSPWANWFSSRYDGHGNYCCDQSDGHFFDGGYEVLKDGSVKISSEIIPAWKVLSGPNPTHRAIWWYAGKVPGDHTTYCFALGPLG